MKIAYIESIQEPEFGCEGRPEGLVVMAEIELIESRSGKRGKFLIPERLLYQSKMDEGYYILKEGEKYYLWHPDKEERIELIPEVIRWISEVDNELMIHTSI